MKLKEIGVRIAKLRMDTGASEREMSLAIGKSDNYINKLENGNGYPSMSAFFDICTYLKITPKEFFSTDIEFPQRLNEVVTGLKRLDEKGLAYISGLVADMSSRYNRLKE